MVEGEFLMAALRGVYSACSSQKDITTLGSLYFWVPDSQTQIIMDRKYSGKLYLTIIPQTMQYNSYLEHVRYGKSSRGD